MTEPNAAALLERLSARDHAILKQLMEGRQSKHIASMLDVSPKRVDKVIERLREKLDAPTRFAAAERYRKLIGEGVISPAQPFPLPADPHLQPPAQGVPADAVFTFQDAAGFSPSPPWATPRKTGAPKPWTRFDTASRLMLMLVGSAALAVAILLVAGLMLGASLLR